MNEPRFVLDPYIVRAAQSVTPDQLVTAFTVLYADLDLDPPESAEVEREDRAAAGKWLKKLRVTPGLALSTGRTNSDRGMWTCCLLSCLGDQRPKAARIRMQIAWDIVCSPQGKFNIGSAPELASELAKWSQSALASEEPSSSGKCPPL